MNAIEIKNLSKHYSEFSLNNINLVLPSGCVMGVIGENGAGKSTLIKLILNMIKKDSGSIKVLEQDNEKYFTSVKERIGVVPDEITFPYTFTVKNVNLIMKNIFKNWREEIFFDYVKKFALPEKKPFEKFSKGMKMKLGIAAALSHEPQLLIFDEATSGLDPLARDSITDIISEFTRNENNSVLMSSHIISDLEKTCDYIAFIHGGNLILCEEKDMLSEKFCTVKGSDEFINSLDAQAVIGKKSTPYGTQAVVYRDMIPKNINVSAVSVEDLFLLMAKEDK